MATVTQVGSVTLTREERTLSLIIGTPKGEPYTATLMRERRLLDAQGNQVGEVESLPRIVCKFDDIANEQITVSGVTMTVAQVTAFIAAWADQKATQIAAQQ